MLVFILFLALLLILQLRLNLFTPAIPGLRVLMYHKILPEEKDFLTVSTSQFEEQICYLLENKYSFLTISDLLEAGSNREMPEKSVLLTFDDAYQNNYEHLLPILKKYNLKASIFIPVGFIGKTNAWDMGSDTIMDLRMLKEASPYFEYGLHSWSHKDLSGFSIDELEDDVTKSISFLEASGLPFLKVLAYPYGRYPKDRVKMSSFRSVLGKNNIQMAFRIGNQINKWPLRDPLLIKRIDIRGTDSFYTFRTKIKKGRVKVF